MKDLRIIIDIDDTINSWMEYYKEWFDTDHHPYRLIDHVITRNVFKLRHNKDFWLNVPKLRDVESPIVAYCTKRVNPKSYTKEWLSKNGFPNKPIYQMLYQHGNKARLIKGKCDVFIDDSVSNFKSCNESGVFTLLIDAPHNRHFNTDLRIYSLNYNEIKEKYEQFRKNFRADI